MPCRTHCLPRLARASAMLSRPRWWRTQSLTRKSELREWLFLANVELVVRHCNKIGARDAKLRARLMDLYRTLSCFPEVPQVLEDLKKAGFVTAILSNGSPSMLADAVAGAKLGHLLDHVLSVEDVGVFKTDRRVYQLAVERLGIPAQEISFQSSNAWDAYAASAFGMRVVWCNRYGQRRERLPGAPDREVRSLAELPPLLVRA